MQSDFPLQLVLKRKVVMKITTIRVCMVVALKFVMTAINAGDVHNEEANFVMSTDKLDKGYAFV